MFFSGLLFVIITGLINIGIIAMDDYFDVVAKIIPAQEVSFSGILDARGLHSPLPALILAVFSKLALKFGLLEPIAQLRFVLVVIGFVSFLIHSLLGLTVFKKSIRESDVFLFFVGFHFLAPLFFTRAMVETLSAPCVSLSVLFVWKSIQNKTRTSLFLSAVFALCAFQLRYQTFAIVPGILLTLILHKKFKETYFYLLSLGLGLVLSGLFEKLLTGEFFGIARPYFEYNLQHSSGHGVTPFYTFILLFLGMALFPFFISGFKNFNWSRYRELRPVLLPFGSFVLFHSLIPHKEERFMVPVLSLFFVILTPLAVHQAQVPWRKWGFIAVNSILLLGASFSVPQRNSILVVDYLSKNSKIERVFDVNDALVMFPEAFGIRKVKRDKIRSADLNKIQLTCSDVVAIRKDELEKSTEVFTALGKSTEFKPGFLEAMLVKLNPRQNARRASILLFNVKGCGV